MPKFNPPDSFQFDKPADWPEWKQRFLRFRTATKLDRETPTVQVSSLAYSVGREAEEIYSSSQLATTVQAPAAGTDETEWYIDLDVNGDPINFKIDSGADVTVISEDPIDHT